MGDGQVWLKITRRKVGGFFKDNIHNNVTPPILKHHIKEQNIC